MNTALNADRFLTMTSIESNDGNWYAVSFEEAIEYAKEHINEIPCGELEYISDSDVLDEENCNFADEE